MHRSGDVCESDMNQSLSDTLNHKLGVNHVSNHAMCNVPTLNHALQHALAHLNCGGDVSEPALRLDDVVRLHGRLDAVHREDDQPVGQAAQTWGVCDRHVRRLVMHACQAAQPGLRSERAGNYCSDQAKELWLCVIQGGS